MDKEIEKALKYIKASSQIENLAPTEEEIEKIKQILQNPSKESSFLRSITQKVKGRKNNGKI